MSPFQVLQQLSTAEAVEAVANSAAPGDRWMALHAGAGTNSGKWLGQPHQVVWQIVEAGGGGMAGTSLTWW